VVIHEDDFELAGKILFEQGRDCLSDDGGFVARGNHGHYAPRRKTLESCGG